MGLGNQVKSLFTSRDLGLRVERLAALYIIGTTPIFRIAGGNIMLTSLFGITSVDHVPGAPTTVQFRADPTSGAAVVLSTAAADLNAAIEGTMFGPTGVVGVACGLGLAIAGFTNGFIIPIGTIDITFGASPSPANIAFVLHYVPLDIGASVAIV